MQLQSPQFLITKWKSNEWDFFICISLFFAGVSNVMNVPVSPVLAALVLTAAILFAVVCIVLATIYRKHSQKYVRISFFLSIIIFSIFKNVEAVRKSWKMPKRWTSTASWTVNCNQCHRWRYEEKMEAFRRLLSLTAVWCAKVHNWWCWVMPAMRLMPTILIPM